MKRILVLLASVGFLAVGVYCLVTGDIYLGLLGSLFGLIGLGSLVLDRARRHGKMHESPYVLLAVVCMGMGVAIGILFIVVGPTSRRGLVRTPDEHRIFGAFVAVVCLIGAWLAIRRWVRSRRSGGPVT